MDGYVRFDTFLVLAQELGDSLDFRLRLGEGTAVGVIAGMRGCTLIWGRKGMAKSDLDAQIKLLVIFKSNKTKSETDWIPHSHVIIKKPKTIKCFAETLNPLS